MPRSQTAPSSAGPALGTSRTVSESTDIGNLSSVGAVCIGVPRNPTKAGTAELFSTSQVMAAPKLLTWAFEAGISRASCRAFISSTLLEFTEDRFSHGTSYYYIRKLQ